MKIEDGFVSERRQRKDVKLKTLKVVKKNLKKSKRNMVTGRKRKNTKSDKMDDDLVDQKKSKKRNRRNIWSGIRARTSPHQLCLALAGMKKKQRETLRKMGFGKMLSFKVDSIPSKLGHYVVDKFDPYKMEINLGKVQIKIDKESVHQLLGIPKSGLSMIPKKKQKEQAAVCEEWKRRNKGKTISPAEITERILESDDDISMMFKIDFIVLFYTTMIECRKNGICRLEILDLISNDTNFNNTDWCQVTVDAMKTCKDSWTRCNWASPFTGPLTVLTLLYVDSISCDALKVERTMRPITFWTMQKLRLRENTEIKNGGFGLGQFRGLYVDDEDCVSDEDGGRNEDEASEDMFEVEDLTGHTSKLEGLYEWNLMNKKHFEKAIAEAKAQYPDNPEIEGYVEKYRRLYVDCVDFESVVKGEAGPTVDFNTTPAKELEMQWTKFLVENLKEVKKSVANKAGKIMENEKINGETNDETAKKQMEKSVGPSSGKEVEDSEKNEQSEVVTATFVNAEYDNYILL